MDSDFLRRWSRLKRRSGAEPVTRPRVSGADMLTEEEIAALPDIKLLTVESDVTCFMRKGVPAALRNAALRRMWMIDPSIRDFVGPARDYSYDWNCPGGVPGNGALESGAATAAMLRRVFGDSEKSDPRPAPETAPAADTEGGGIAADEKAPDSTAEPIACDQEGDGSCGLS